MVAHADSRSNPPPRLVMGLPAEPRRYHRACLAEVVQRPPGLPRRSASGRMGAGLPRRSAWCLARRRDLRCHAAALQSIQLYSRRSGGGGGCEAPVGQRQPLGQLARGLVGRRAVKRHHRGRHSRAAAQLRPPPVTDGRHFDLVRTPADSFFEAMNDHVVCCPGGVGKKGRFYASRRRDQAKRDAKGASTAGITGDRVRCAKKNISLSGSAQVLHGSSTGFPQLQ
jgi:hypothetical protein